MKFFCERYDKETTVFAILETIAYIRQKHNHLELWDLTDIIQRNRFFLSLYIPRPEGQHRDRFPRMHHGPGRNHRT